MVIMSRDSEASSSLLFLLLCCILSSNVLVIVAACYSHNLGTSVMAPLFTCTYCGTVKVVFFNIPGT